MMDRLTFMNGDDIWCVDNDNCYEEQSEHYCGPAIERLADYEDTGMEPEEIKEMVQNVETRSLAWFYKKFGIGAGRMMDLAEADRDGRLIVLPCKVGETVYTITFDDCFNGKCPWLADGKCTRPDYCPLEVIPWTFDLKLFESGRKFYLSREKAEAKIRKIKEERNHG